MKDIVCWWSGGVTSAVACKKAIDLYGKERCIVIMIDTKNEHHDTYRFLKDCEEWYGIPIDSITAIGSKYESIQDVWRRSLSLNVATGAICSTNLKRRVREAWEKQNKFIHQVFGFEFDSKEFKRAMGMAKNHPIAGAIFPLLMYGLDKKDCIKIINDAGIDVPLMYTMGFRNNNCFGTGCVQGGIGYWKKMQLEFLDKFEAMAAMEHELTDKKGEPVTMLKDQSNAAKEASKEDKTLSFVFLKKHPAYPNNKCIDDMEGRPVEPLMECNGYCGTNDFIDNSAVQADINYITEEEMNAFWGFLD